MPDSFNGFPPAATQFLNDLAANNNKAWFEAHKQVYLDTVQAPALALVSALGERLKEHFPAIHYDLRTNGSGSLMRLYRDTRFSADKSPYKTNVAMMFSAGGKKMAAAGFGLQLTPQDVGTMAGIFTFSKEALDAFRQAVQEKALGGELERAAEQVRAKSGYTLGGETYKRIPAGLPADHPRARWFKYTGLHAYSPTIPLDIAHSPALVDVAMDHFMAMSPVYLWLSKVFQA
jgi:uncharacterized protein (TIGR02453 family)